MYILYIFIHTYHIFLCMFVYIYIHAQNMYTYDNVGVMCINVCMYVCMHACISM